MQQPTIRVSYAKFLYSYIRLFSSHVLPQSAMISILILSSDHILSNSSFGSKAPFETIAVVLGSVSTYVEVMDYLST